MGQKIQLKVLIFLGLFYSQTSFAYDFEVDGIYYTLDTSTSTVYVDKGNYSGVITIPSSVTYNNKTLNVTYIGKEAFSSCKDLKQVIIPETIKRIEESAFSGSGIENLVIPYGITTIRRYLCSGCRNLVKVVLPETVEIIEEDAFQSCESLLEAKLPESLKSIGTWAFLWCYKLEKIIIPNQVNQMGESVFVGCESAKKLVIGHSIKSLRATFEGCKSLISANIPNNVNSITNDLFHRCSRMDSITIENGESVIRFEGSSYDGTPEPFIKYLYLGRGIEGLGNSPFETDSIKVLVFGKTYDSPKNICSKPNSLTKVYSNITSPSPIDNFTNNAYVNATLYVPKGTKPVYEQTDGWKQFLNIVEDPTLGEGQAIQKCERPTIQYTSGKLSFYSGTDGVIFRSTITNSDISNYSSNEIQLGVTYTINVFATKEGFENSDIASATLCWIDVEPKTEGIDNSVAQVKANAVLIQTGNGQISISGVDDGTKISVYGINGLQVGTATSHNGQAIITPTLQSGNIAIIKIGDRSVKVAFK